MKYIETIISSILAGICIGIGGTVFLMSGLTLAGSFLFSIGLFVICSFDLKLFTGQIGYVLQENKSFAVNIPIVLVGNLFGAWIMAMLVKLADMVTVMTYATILSQHKLDHGFRAIFFLAILCNILIYIAVEGYRTINNQIGKYIALFMSVTIFVYCGFEHSIADMFYFSVSGFTRRAVVAILVVIAGNAVGGIITHNAHLLVKNTDKPTQTSPIEEVSKTSSFENIIDSENEE